MSYTILHCHTGTYQSSPIAVRFESSCCPKNMVSDQVRSVAIKTDSNETMQNSCIEELYRVWPGAEQSCAVMLGCETKQTNGDNSRSGE
jgi:hypothetical protein